MIPTLFVIERKIPATKSQKRKAQPESVQQVTRNIKSNPWKMHMANGELNIHSTLTETTYNYL